MTTDDLNAALDAMQTAANGDTDKMPGLITIDTTHWIDVLSAIKATIARLDDGLRHRDIRVAIGSTEETKILTRAEAGDRGAPYRDLT
ncbi:hypothetical protein [Brevundimonas sp.]|uniref:hypothetical protein n=1 Tax=Brevundimonas sp. TaxID=1871086 RepID=UPI00289E5592|nr:hypothetical protein [Brevundimonas sp.]